MANRVKALKLETSDQGVQDFLPTEANPSEDYLRCHGTDMGTTDDVVVIDSTTNIMRFKDSQVTTAVSLKDLKDGNFSSFLVYSASSSTAFVTSSRTPNYVAITSFTLTPAAGLYVAFYNAAVLYTATPKPHYWAIYVDNTVIAESKRQQDTAHSSQLMVDTTQALITCNGSNVVSVRVACADTGTLTVNQRTLTLVRYSL